MSDVLYKSIVKLLNCPQCGKQIQIPVKVCSNGHTICVTCSKNNPSCKVCASTFVSNNHVLLNSILEATKSKEKFLEKLIQTLECPVCYNQIKSCCVCVNGHGVCTSCARLTYNCPLCRKYFVYSYSAVIRLLLNVLNTKIPCTNWSQCRTSCSYSELLDHEAICDKTKCHCIIESCSWNGSVVNLELHVERWHPENILLENDSSLELCQKFGSRYLMLKAQGNTFWLVCKNNLNGLNLAIQIHDLHCNYKAQIILQTKHQILKLTQNILTMKENILEAMLNGNCLNIPSEIVARFDKDEHSTCYIKILEQNTKNLTSCHQSNLHKIMAFLFVLNVFLFCIKVAK